MTVIHVSGESEFSRAVNSGKLCVVDWSATWCGPCKAVAPRFDKLSGEHPGVIFLKVDVDEQQALAKEHSVSAMPTFHFFRSGKKLDEVVGADINKVERLVRSLAGAGGATGGGFPATGGRVLGTGAPAARAGGGGALQSNHLLWGAFGAFVLWLWWNKEGQ
ncbi:hypothetical protein HKX48_005726 [Thoreauomyces humboldtii]|nr:hypothetical protein HKX48_005726 [Thoreauomyces humboldtii]